jgi:hypothetical protein
MDYKIKLLDISNQRSGSNPMVFVRNSGFVRVHFVVRTLGFINTIWFVHITWCVYTISFLRIEWFGHLYHLATLLRLFDNHRRPSIRRSGLSPKSQGLDYTSRRGFSWISLKAAAYQARHYAQRGPLNSKR